MGITPRNWENFFYDRSEGLGTLYERLILQKILKEIVEKYRIRTVLECPSFGMTGYSGINSWFLAKIGLNVWVGDDNPKRLAYIRKLWKIAKLNANFVKVDSYCRLPFDDDSFDMVWNFAALWYLKEDIEDVLSELARVCRKIIFICLPNKNLFYIFRKIIEFKFFKFVKEEYLSKEFEDLMITLFSKCGFKLVDKRYFDTPPWPDFAIKLSDLKPGNVEWPGKIVLPEYYDYLCNVDLGKKIDKIFVFENLPTIFKRLWSHHVSWIFIR